jgi:hypothetical protein
VCSADRVTRLGRRVLLGEPFPGGGSNLLAYWRCAWAPTCCGRKLFAPEWKTRLLWALTGNLGASRPGANTALVGAPGRLKQSKRQTHWRPPVRPGRGILVELDAWIAAQFGSGGNTGLRLRSAPHQQLWPAGHSIRPRPHCLQSGPLNST